MIYCAPRIEQQARLTIKETLLLSLFSTDRAMRQPWWRASSVSWMKMCRNSFLLDSIFGIGTPAHASSTNIGLQQRCRSLSSDGTVGCGRGSCRRLGIVCVETFSRWDKGISFVNVIDPLQVFTRAAFVKAKTAVVSCKTFFWSIGARGMSLGMTLWEEGKACTWEAPSHRVPSSASALLIFLPSSVTIIALGVLSSQ